MRLENGYELSMLALSLCAVWLLEFVLLAASCGVMRATNDIGPLFYVGIGFSLFLAAVIWGEMMGACASAGDLDQFATRTPMVIAGQLVQDLLFACFLCWLLHPYPRESWLERLLTGKRTAVPPPPGPAPSLAKYQREARAARSPRALV
jgi:hypothetical protein